MKRAALAGSFLLALPLAAAVGPEFRANQVTTGNQDHPRVALDTTGSFVVTWDRDFNSIWARRFTTAGAPIGSDFRVNLSAGGSQANPAVAAAGTGFVVCWENFSTLGAMCQRFDGSEAFAGERFSPSGNVGSGTVGPRVGSDSSGNFVAVWHSPDGNADGIFGRRYKGDGTALTDPFRVNETTSGFQSFTSVAVTPAGDFVVAWDGGDGSIWARRFGSDGAPLTGEFRLSEGTLNLQPDVALDASGNFTVVWQTEDGSQHGVAGRRHSSAGDALGGVFVVNALTTGDQYVPTIAYDSTGDFMVTWANAVTGNADVTARQFRSNGTPKTATDFRVNAYTTGAQYYAVPAAGPSGTILVVWSSPQDGDQRGIYARLYTGPCLSGDANGDGSADIADVFYLINNLFAGGPAPVCSGDVNASFGVDIADVFYLINFLFAGGPPPL
jgi:hypothetical protein